MIAPANNITLDNADAFGLTVGAIRTVRTTDGRQIGGTVTSLIEDRVEGRVEGDGLLQGIVVTDAAGDSAAIPACMITAVLTLTANTA